MKRNSEQPSKKKYDPLEGVPPDEALQEKTIEDDTYGRSLPSDHLDSMELSDLSEQEEVRRWKSLESLSIYTFYTRLRPLMKSPEVRVLALLNCILTFVNVLLLGGVATFVAIVTYHQITYNRWHSHDMPCIYEWAPWSNCSAACTTPRAEGLIFPTKTRVIDEDRIVDARGSKRSCPPDLRNWTDTAPCNTHLCPRKLSEFSAWTDCFHKNPLLGKEGGCYRMRNIPPDDNLVKIDVLDLVQDCSDAECPESIQ
ncbi:hypothetical protein QR680_012198 [Steinernema hermaphroditum]|uniref:Uncharacterized protein n=1 Tax=Steinernema hermaphroditum TaxID=289476 RepID=A0AA39I2W2_9BILA|nr:hypothetical protein QR680_012198 [Steinernema hermaphroditum]